MKWVSIGYIKIKTVSSSDIYIRLFRTNSFRGAFKINETYYRGSHDYLIVELIQDCHDRYLGNKTESSNK